MISPKFFTPFVIFATTMIVALPMKKKKGLEYNSLVGHTDRVSSLKSFYHNGRYYAVTGSWDSDVRVWDLETRDCIREFDGATNPVVSLCCMRSGLSDYPDDMLIISGTGKIYNRGSDDFRMRICSFNTGKQIGSLNGHADNVTSICSVRKNIIASCSLDNTIRIWDLENMECIQTLSTLGHTLSIITHLDDNTLASADWDAGCIAIWDLRFGQCIKTFYIPPTRVVCLQEMFNLQLLSWDDGCKLGDLHIGQKKHTFIQNLNELKSWGMQAMAPYDLCPETLEKIEHIIVVKSNGELWLYDYTTGEDGYVFDSQLFGITNLAVAGHQLVYASDVKPYLCISPNPFFNLGSI